MKYLTVQIRVRNADIMSLKPKTISQRKIIDIFRSYTSNATVHGLSYITDISLPFVDRVVWFGIVLIFGGCAAYLSHGVFGTWQSNMVVTTLKDTELPVTQLDFPAITICSQGLDMKAVERVIEADYERWKESKPRNKRALDENEMKDVEDFLAATYGIQENLNIFEVINGMVSEDPERSIANNGIR